MIFFTIMVKKGVGFLGGAMTTMKWYSGFLLVFCVVGCNPLIYDRNQHFEREDARMLIFESPEGTMRVSFSGGTRNRTCRNDVLEKRTVARADDLLLLLSMEWPEIRIMKNDSVDSLLEVKDRRSGTEMLFTTKWVLNAASFTASFLKHAPNPASTSFFCSESGYGAVLRKDLANPKFARILAEESLKSKFVPYCEAVLLFSVVYSYGKAIHCWEGSERERKVVLSRGREVVQQLGIDN